MNRAALVVTAFLTLAACSSAAGPAWLPRAGNAVAPSDLAPRHFHATPFFNFRGRKLGEQPVPGLIGDSADNLYGVTTSGGDLSCAAGNGKGCGLVYELVHVSGFDFNQKIVHAFHGSDGAFPDSQLAGGNGVFFGTTSHGGANDAGTVFVIRAKSGRMSTLYTFKGGSDGAFPIGTLYLDSKGNIFGTTAFGGNAGCTDSDEGGTGCGTVFELTPSKSGYAKKMLYRFSAGGDGWEPWAGVIPYNGKLYGTTTYGGSPACTGGCGTLFELSSSGKRTVRKFGGGADGAYAKSPLYADSSGNMYGETQYGGSARCHIPRAEAYGCGVIFRVSADGSLATVIHRFAGRTRGAQPNIGVTHFQGALFGTTTYGTGIAFSIRPGGKGFDIIDQFGAGENPSIFLCAISNELNGTTSTGGKYGYGTIFVLSQ